MSETTERLPEWAHSVRTFEDAEGALAGLDPDGERLILRRVYHDDAEIWLDSERAAWLGRLLLRWAETGKL